MTATATLSAPATIATGKLSAAEVLARLEAAGVRLRVEGGLLYLTPKGAVTDDLRALAKAHKPELLEVVAKRGAIVAAPLPAGPLALAKPATGASPSPSPDTEPERRRQQALAMLERNPALRIAVVANSSGDPVELAVAIRDKGTCEVHIPAARFCPFKLWELVAQHSGSVH